MYNNVPSKMDKEAREEHERKFGGFNDWPPNVREIPANEFWSYFFTYGIGANEHRQMITRVGTDHDPVSKEERRCMIQQGVSNGFFYQSGYFFYKGDGSDSGYIMTRDVTNAKVYPRKFYKFSVCEHEYVEKNVGRCLHEYTCTKCGHRFQVDSSD